ncbi:MAG: 4a-hydroxytetrahydrobiopterin dehydratase [Allomuricauda sp.]|nr:MAG: 4a-hydroxytetrahydrobiopterin dehydratase [Allomuricauda sp.]
MEKLTEKEITILLQDLKGWSYQNGSIVKVFKFKDFRETFATMTRIAFECEAQNHHPDWENVYNTLTINLNTHDAGGVTKKDFRLAGAIEQLVNAN